MWWLKVFGPLLAGLGSLFFFWKKLRKYYPSLKSYYQIILVLVDAIERIETATDKIPDQLVVIAKMIKAFVRTSLKREDREKLDVILDRKGYLKKKGGEQ